MTYKCTLQGRSMGAATISFKDAADALWSAAKGIPGVGDLLGIISYVPGVEGVAKTLLIQKLQTKFSSEMGLTNEANLNTGAVADKLTALIAETIVEQVQTYLSVNVADKESSFYVFYNMAFVAGSTTAKSLILNALNGILSKTLNVTPKEDVPIGPGWDAGTGTTGGTGTGTTGGTGTGYTVVPAATVSELAMKVEAIARQVAVQFIGAAKAKNDMPSFGALQSVLAAPSGTLANKYFAKLSELLTKVTKNPSVAASICAAASPLLASLTILSSVGVAAQAKAVMIGAITPQLLAYAKGVIASGSVVVGTAPPSGGVKSGSGMDSKTIMLIAAAGVAALILLKK